MGLLDKHCRQFHLTSTSLEGCSFKNYRGLMLSERLSHSNLVTLREVTEEMVKSCNEVKRACILTATVVLPFKTGTNRWNERFSDERITFFVLGYDAEEVLAAAGPLLDAVINAHTPETEYVFHQ